MPLFQYPTVTQARASADLFEKGRYHVRDVGKHAGMTLCVRFDSRRIACGGADKTVKVYNRDAALSLFSEFGRAGGGHKGNVRWIQFDQDKLISGSADNTCFQWDWNGTVVNRFLGHTDEVNSLQFDDGVLVTGSDDKTVRMFDIRTTREVMNMRGHKNAVYHVQFRDFVCMSCDKDNNIIEWDLRTYRQVHRLQDGSGHYRCYFDDSQIIACGTQQINIWDRESYRHLNCIDTGRDGADFSLWGMHVDDTSIVAVGKQLVIYDRRTHQLIKRANDHEGDMYGVYFDDRTIGTVGFNNRVRLWEFSA